MSKKIAIIQSNYIPWKGYFDMIGLVDEFIIYDEVQYTKNDWRNRNKIKSLYGLQWVTIPVYQKSLNQKISETQVSDMKWASKHWNTMVTNYAKAPHFKSVAPLLEHYYKTTTETFLSKINIELIRIICKYLGIQTSISSSSSYQLVGNPTQRLVQLCKQTHASSYLTGPAAKNYLDTNLFVTEGIQVQWMNYQDYPEYQQRYPPFEHSVSIVDLLFNTGTQASKYMKFSKK